MSEEETRRIFEQIIEILKNQSDALGKMAFQQYFNWLYRYALLGMNFGSAADKVQYSGERLVIHFLKKFTPENQIPVVFDVGANRGDYSLEVLNAFANKVDLYCFEPSNQPFHVLKQKLGKFDNVKLFNIGLGREHKTITMFGFHPSEGISTVSETIHGNQINYSQEVEIQSVEEFCQRHHLDRIDLLKMDVEGYEMEVLKGAQNMIDANAIRHIQFEFGHVNIYTRVFFKDFFEFLSPRYTIYRILQDGFLRIPRHEDLWEVFLNANYLAIAKH